MLYDPLTENNVKTTKLMQYVATFVGQFFCLFLFYVAISKYSVLVCLGAISAGTALAWTSPVLPQMTSPNITVVGGNVTAQNITSPADDDQLYLTPDQSECLTFIIA